MGVEKGEVWEEVSVRGGEAKAAKGRQHLQTTDVSPGIFPGVSEHLRTSSVVFSMTCHLCYPALHSVISRSKVPIDGTHCHSAKNNQT